METNVVRRAGFAAVLGGGLTAASGLFVQAVVAPASTVSSEMWSYPWSASAVVPVSLVYAVLHLLVIYGLWGFRDSGLAGRGRAARVGGALAVAGTALLTLGELGTVPIADARMDDPSAGMVGALFGLGTLVSAVGFLVLGSATLRAGAWDGWRRLVPIALGLWTTALVGLAFTPALPFGVAVYGALLALLGVAMVTRPATTAGSGGRSPQPDAVDLSRGPR